MIKTRVMSMDELMEMLEIEHGYTGEQPVRKPIRDADIHKDICMSLNKLFEAKNARYGNSFAEQYEEFGMLSLIIRLSDKLNRLKTLQASDMNHLDESMADTLADLANYAIMGLVELEKNK